MFRTSFLRWMFCLFVVAGCFSGMHAEEQAPNVALVENNGPALQIDNQSVTPQQLNELAQMLAERLDSIVLKKNFMSKAKRAAKIVVSEMFVLGAFYTLLKTFLASFASKDLLCSLLETSDKTPYNILYVRLFGAVNPILVDGAVLGCCAALSSELTNALPYLERKKLIIPTLSLMSIALTGAVLGASVLAYARGERQIDVLRSRTYESIIVNKESVKIRGKDLVLLELCDNMRLFFWGATLLLVAYVIKIRCALAKKQTPEVVAELHQDALKLYQQICSCQTLEQYNILKEKITALVLKEAEVSAEISV